MSGQECFECLATEDQAGYQAYVNALVGNCYCANDCEASCTDFVLIQACKLSPLQSATPVLMALRQTKQVLASPASLLIVKQMPPA